MVDSIGDIATCVKPHPREWWIGFLAGFMLFGVFGVAVSYSVYMGVGIWGINVPVAWGFAIINFVWWIGIGHAGTLISAILLLLHQKWRTSINRFSEAMTIFAVMCAGMFPLLHMGRPWFFYWLFPFPNNFGMWPQFRSPLAWDVFAVTTYFTVSLVFWYIGLIPDFAVAARIGARPRFSRSATASSRSAGVARHPLAALREGLPDPGRHLDAAGVLRAHGRVLRLRRVDRSLVARDDLPAVLRRPGPSSPASRWCWSLAIPLRKWYHLEDFITDQHIDNCAKVMLATGHAGHLRLLQRSLDGLVQPQRCTSGARPCSACSGLTAGRTGA